MPAARLNPTIFDKLVADLELDGLRREGDEQQTEVSRASMRFYTVPKLDRFNESALREIIRRDIAWLLNTVRLEALVDLEQYPRVKSSTLNYGVAELAGKALGRRVLLERARDIRAALQTFEPRLDPKSLEVVPQDTPERENAVTYVIRGDITAAVEALFVQLKTDVEADTSAVTVRD